MASRDQEKPAANLLRQSLRDSGDNCPGPDILAAYFERSLDKEETARYEEHLSRCVRCRGQVAALDRADAPGGAQPPQPSLGLWLRDWRRLTPVAAALIVVVAVWIARRPTLKQAAEPPQLVAMSQPEQAPTTSVGPESPREARPAPGSTPTAKPAKTGGKPLFRDTAPPKSKEAETDSLAAGAAASPAPAPPATFGGHLEQDATASNAEAISPASSSVEMKNHPAAAARLSAQGPKEEARALEAVDRRSTTAMISTPDPKVLWRIADGGFVERSQDGGASWQAQLPVAGAQPTAGSAPSETVCWLVGRGGLIALTTNAKDWKRIPAAVPADFVAITARDDSTATVTTVDGHQFMTRDGGAHWKALP